MWQVWAVVAVICLILELTAGDFFIICFSIGSVFAAITAAVGGGIYWQLAIFACLHLNKPVLGAPVHPALRPQGDDEGRVSNADALMGREGRVVETIVAGGYGRVQIDGDIWKAVSNAPHNIAEGTPVRVIDRASTIITVETV